MGHELPESPPPPSRVWILALTRKTPSGELNIGPIAAFASKAQVLSHCDAYLKARAREELHLDADAEVSDLAADQRLYYGRKEVGGGLEVGFVCGGYWVLGVVEEVEVLEV